MIGKNPLDQIKHVATETLKHPAAVAGTGLRTAKHLAEAGLTAGTQLTTKVAQKLGSRMPTDSSGREQPDSHADDTADLTDTADTAEPETDPRPQRDAADEGSQDDPAIEIDPERPVNVVKELGLDPAPAPDTQPEPTTSIDAAADPDSVDATPADVADVVEDGNTQS